MSDCLVIIISGPPGAGKTTLAKKISREFGLPSISKDAIKESLFDDLGWSDREWSKKLGKAAYGLLYQFMERLLSVKTSFIVESNFKPEFENEKLNDLKQRYDFEWFQIQCRTDGEILLKRFEARAESGARHPGHVDQANLAEFKASLLKGGYENLDIGGKIAEIDTTDFKAIDYARLFSDIRSSISKKFDTGSNQMLRGSNQLGR